MAAIAEKEKIISNLTVRNLPFHVPSAEAVRAVVVVDVACNNQFLSFFHIFYHKFTNEEALTKSPSSSLLFVGGIHYSSGNE